MLNTVWFVVVTVLMLSLVLANGCHAH